MINTASLFLGKPQNFKDKCKIYPPSVDDVVNNNSFNEYFGILNITQEDLEDEFANIKDESGKPIQIPTPLEFILANAYGNSKMEKTLLDAFEFFIHEKVTILYDLKYFLIGSLEDEIIKINNVDELTFITEEDFFDFQNIIRVCCGQSEVEPYVYESNEKIRRMKALARKRNRVKAKNSAKSGDSPTLDTLLASICCMGIGLTPLNIGEISYASLYKLLSVYQKHEKYENDIKSLMMGAKAKDLNFKYWIRNSE